jgi:hypothetical protein
MGEKPSSGSFYIVKGGSSVCHQVPDDGAEAEKKASSVIEIGGKSEEAGLSEPIALVAEVLAHAKDVVKDDDTWSWAGGGGNGKIRGHLTARSRNEDVGHRRSPTSDCAQAADRRF